MSKVKGFLLVAGIVLAMAFTKGEGPSFSNSNSNGACYVDNFVQGTDIAMCFTGKELPITRDYCDYMATLTGRGRGLQYRDSCPPGYKQESECEDNYYYFYGSLAILETEASIKTK